MTRVLLHTEIKSKTNKYNLHKEKNPFTNSVNVYFGNCKRAQSLERVSGKGSRERQTVSKGEVDVIKVVEGRGRGLKKGVVSPCVQAGAAH